MEVGSGVSVGDGITVGVNVGGDNVSVAVDEGRAGVAVASPETARQLISRRDTHIHSGINFDMAQL